ncbi:kinase-like domain-containing protein [Rhodocollybia butyracea]|uniref:Kinase-like domain-containing protein n=1 Tax=Rhodocollybia butyracea TaxID=206335 RepID=A0A9P5PFV4_9AGAR|nr:kinase-like domain-containing protein [Rhodocollybia butyracea]
MVQPTLVEIATFIRNRFLHNRSALNVTEEVSALGVKLGEGMFGDVYAADWTHPDTGAVVPVAVKLLKNSIANKMNWTYATVYELANHELSCWLEIEPHENVLPIIGFSWVQTEGLPSVPGLVTPRVDRPNIRSVLETEATTFEQRRQIIIQVANGLQHIHSANIVHGDFHPGNIFLHQGRALIADFGLSKVVGASTIVPHQQLRDKDELGVYMNVPELVEFDESDDDTPRPARTQKSDIYMLGKSADYILTFEIADALRYLHDECLNSDPAARPSAEAIALKFHSFN